MSNLALNNDVLIAAPFVPASPPVAATGFVTVQGRMVVRNGDVAATHTDNIPTVPVVHPGATMLTTTPWFTIAGVPVIVDGDNATCGHSIVATGFVQVG